MDYSLPYLGAFIDADGCITRHGTTWELVIVQTSRPGDSRLEPLEACRARWGGRICQRTSRSEKHAPLYQWKISGFPVAIALTDLYFHLNAKRAKAQECLEFYANHPKWGWILRRIGEAPPESDFTRPG